MEDLFTVGVVTTAHGIKGELKVFPTTDDAKRFKKLKEVIVKSKHKTETVKVESVKFFKQFVILKLEGIDDMDTAYLYKNAELCVTRDNAVKCEKDEYFIADLIGIKVYDEDKNLIGTVSEVLQTGANDVYEIKREDDSLVYIPAIKECILSVDIPSGVMNIHVMEGLF